MITTCVDPIFKVGTVPGIPWCEIQDVSETSGGHWHYFIANHYNAWASGWMTEDDVIAEISRNRNGKRHKKN